MVLGEICCLQKFLLCVIFYDVVFLLREQNEDDIRNYSDADVAKDIYPKILEKRKLAICCFVTLVINSEMTILKKFIKAGNKQ